MNNKYREYSERFILSRKNPEYAGVAKNYTTIRKQRAVTQELKNEASHQVSYMKKLNERLDKSLERKKKQLNYVQSIRNRYISQSLQKQFLNDMKKQDLQKLKSKNHEIKQQNTTKLKESKDKLKEKNKLSSIQLRNQLRQFKEKSELRQSRIQQMNKSRVQEIQRQKKETIQATNRFYQTRNKKIMENYKNLSKKQQKSMIKDRKEVQKLQAKLLQLNKKMESQELILQKINETITSVRQESSQRSRRQVSSRSMTPLILRKYMKQSETEE